MRFWIFTLLLLAVPVARAQDPIRERLERSPRHQEWVAITYDDRTVHTFVVYPERDSPATAVVLIHENRGLSDWVRSVADRLAEAGYLALAPDLLSGMAPGGGRTADFPGEDAAREAIYRLPPEQVMADLDAVVDYARNLPAASGKVAVAGFCWGGAQAFRFATHRPDLAAAFVFYGTGPDDPEAVARIQCPVYGFYGGNDARVNATIPRTDSLMRAAGKTFVYEIYEGAGHAFMRRGETADTTDANRRARDAAWQRWLRLLQAL
ncbi:dienelactone hydrolase family protein [Rhodothermus marinus]|uniref:dienelactone hydrolase family protein n=1 Tax=Rhodothermus marinus TaxID=29549 RepID=UPI0037C8FE60